MPTIELKIATPRVPNFLFTEGNNPQQFRVGDMPDDALREIAAAWGEALIVNAHRQRNNSER